MELVVDANVLMSALIAMSGKTYDLLYNERLRLFAPEFLMEEIGKYKDEIASKSGLSLPDINIFLALIRSRITFIPKFEFEQFIHRAEKISPDKNDAEYFALAMKLQCAIWSNDKQLKKQDDVKVHSTTELLIQV